MNGEEERDRDDSATDDMVVLEDEEGEEHLFELLDLVELEGVEYVVLWPEESDEEELGEVVILMVVGEGEDGVGTYVTVDDDAALERVFGIFRARNEGWLVFVGDCGAGPSGPREEMGDGGFLTSAR